ncbi:MAG: metallophosphoesterase [Planctomycetota bacterium]
MTRFAVIGDIHERMGRLHAVLAHLADEPREPIDGVLLVGDIAEAGMERFANAARDRHWRDQVDVILDLVRETLQVPIAWVPGNHDMRGYEDERENVDGRVATIGGVRIAGIGGAGPARFGFRYEWSEDDIRGLDVPDCDILLCHAPPISSGLDANMRGTPCGSAAIRERAEAHRGVLLCGHIHEAGGTTLLGRCVAYNPGALGEPYGATQYGLLGFDVVSGRVQITHRNLETDDDDRVTVFETGSR